MRSNVLESPYIHEDLLVKCGYNGVTVLKDGRFRSRMQGSRSHTLLPNGQLIDNSLLKQNFPHLINSRNQKKLPAGKKIQIKSSLSPSEKTPREYRVNKKLIRQRVFSFLLGQKKPELYAFTVSFPPCVGDDLAFQALNIWLTTCRDKLKLKNYLWVAERQEIGTIHYHLLIPQYLNVHKANRHMANTLANFVRKKELKWNVSAAKRYNGVHIGKDEKTKRITNFALGSKGKALSNYITKYISKNDTPFKHYAWHNSRGFSAVFTSIALTEAEAKYFKIRGAVNMDRCFTSEYATFVGWKNSPAEIYLSALRFVNGLILNKGTPSDRIHTKLTLKLAQFN